jgi:hypothetical protein
MDGIALPVLGFLIIGVLALLVLVRTRGRRSLDGDGAAEYNPFFGDSGDDSDKGDSADSGRAQ